MSVCNELIIQHKDRVDFKIVHSNVNNGVGYGINRLNDLSIDYEYSLFLEGDWITLPKQYTNQDKNWLIRSLELMDKENLDLSKSKWKIEDSISSTIIYESLCENYGKNVVDTVLAKLEIVSSDLSLGDNQKIILKI